MPICPVFNRMGRHDLADHILHLIQPSWMHIAITSFVMSLLIWSWVMDYTLIGYRISISVVCSLTERCRDHIILIVQDIRYQCLPSGILVRRLHEIWTPDRWEKLVLDKMKGEENILVSYHIECDNFAIISTSTAEKWPVLGYTVVYHQKSGIFSLKTCIYAMEVD